MDGRLFLTYEDVQFCWAVLIHGGDVFLAPGANATHQGGRSLLGGYPADGPYETTELRLGLGLRNALTTLLICAPAPVIPALVILWTMRALLTAALGVFGHRSTLVKACGRAALWNLRELPTSLRRRHSLGSHAGRRTAWRRVDKRSYLTGLLLRHRSVRLIQ
jgi:hypothetical protein